MFPTEREVMDLWDAGSSIEAISAATGKTRRYVRKIVTCYHIERDDEIFAARARAGSRALLSAIQCAGLAA